MKRGTSFGIFFVLFTGCLYATIVAMYDDFDDDSWSIDSSVVAIPGMSDEFSDDMPIIAPQMTQAATSAQPRSAPMAMPVGQQPVSRVQTPAAAAPSQAQSPAQAARQLLPSSLQHGQARQKQQSGGTFKIPTAPVRQTQPLRFQQKLLEEQDPQELMATFDKEVLEFQQKHMEQFFRLGRLECIMLHFYKSLQKRGMLRLDPKSDVASHLHFEPPIPMSQRFGAGRDALCQGASGAPSYQLKRFQLPSTVRPETGQPSAQLAAPPASQQSTGIQEAHKYPDAQSSDQKPNEKH